MNRHHALLKLICLGDKGHDAEELLKGIKDQTDQWLFPLKLLPGTIECDYVRNLVTVLMLSKLVSQPDQGDTEIDVDLLISSIQEHGPLWDSRDPRHMDQVVLRRLWVEVAKSLWDGFDSASAKDKGNFLKKLRTRWRSMKDRFNKGLRAEEEQSRSGAAASKSVPYKYSRALQFLRPILGRRQTHSSTLERARPAGADLHESPSDLSQPSHSDSRLAPPSGEPTITDNIEEIIIIFIS
ncbi:uncharacterized protein LOC143795599 [Ranitomeya variabilis]|uniref:uncharacterized protein LOC143795599 n=1 Tax=Ranitomeya variabilis TaxID=490064 RepID=UPI004055C7DC